MNLTYENKYFVDTEKVVSFSNEYGSWNYVNSEILLGTDKFVEYQKDMINEFHAQLDEIFQNSMEEEVDFFKTKFEELLEDFNSKFNIFADKLNDVERLSLKWVLQVYFKWVFIASMLWDVSLIIFRDWKLVEVVDNEFDKNLKVDNFSEFIEWELENGDQILSLWVRALDLFNKSDIEEALNISVNEEKALLEVLEEVIWVRLSLQQLWFLSLSKAEIRFVVNKDIIKNKPQFDFIKITKKFKDLSSFKYPIVITWMVALILFLFYSILTIETSDPSIVNEDGSVSAIDFTIEDLNREILEFKKISASSDEKSRKYTEILDKLDKLDAKNKWPQDVIRLRKSLNVLYYKWFNIFLESSLDNDKKVYSFTDEEKAWLWTINNIYENKGLNIAWSKWAVLWAVNDKVKGKLVNYNIPSEIDWCNVNLLANWLYCYGWEWNIFNVQKSTLQSVTTKSVNFASKIGWVETFGKNRFYVLNTDKLEENGWIITKYNNLLGSQTSFTEGTNYTFDEKYFEANKAMIWSWFSSFVIDGTFLVWSKANKSLVQLWRDWTTLSGREIPLKGGSKIWDWFSSNVKIYTTDSAKYVYLFDVDNQTLSVYQSRPYKTNSANATSYNLHYFFSIKFDVPWVNFIDAYIEHWTKPIAYFVGDSWVFKVSLSEYFDDVSQQ